MQPQAQISLDDCSDLMDQALARIESNNQLLALEALVSLMQLVCGQVEDLGLLGASHDQIVFWNRLNSVWMQVLDSCQGMAWLESLDWAALSEAVESSANILELFGLVDYPLGFQETFILEKIHRLESQ